MELEGGTAQLSIEPLDGDSARMVIVSEVRADTLLGTGNQFGYSGELECEASFPLANDTLLLAAGFDPLVPRLGGWVLYPPELPID